MIDHTYNEHAGTLLCIDRLPMRTAGVPKTGGVHREPSPRVYSSRYDNYTVNDDTRSVKFRVTEVTFADKTNWRP